MRLVRDVDLELDTSRGRVGDYDREAVVRLFREYEFRTLIDRLPPLLGERPEDAIAAMRELRDAGFPAAQGAGAWRRGRAPRRGCAGTQSARRAAPAVARLRPDRRRVGGARPPRPPPARRDGGGDADRAEARAERVAVAAGDLPGALAAAIVDPGRIEVVDADGVAALEPWLRGQDAVGIGPRAGRPAAARRDPARARRRRRRTGASSRPTARTPRSPCATCWSGSTPGSSATRSSRCSPRASPRTPDADAARRSRSTPRSPPTSSTPRCGPRRSPTSSRSGWTSSCRPTAAGPPADRRRGARGARCARRPAVARAGAPRRRRRPPVRRDRAAADPDPRPHGGGRASRSTATRCARSRSSSRPRSRASSARSSTPSATSSRSAAPSSWARSCSWSSACPRAARRRPATRPTRRVLEELRGVHPVIEPVLEWRIFTKLRSTYVEALPTLIGPDGRLHTLFNQAVAATGPPVELRPEPPEHPDPDAARPPDPARVRRGLAGHDARRRGLQPDRAPDPRPRERRRAPARRVRARGRHPPRDRRPGAAQGARGRRRPTSGRWPRWSTSGSPTG